jgi:AraC-like DNA-binding protein
MDFAFDTKSDGVSFVERVWHTRSEHAGTFTSTATCTWELVVTTFEGKTTVTARGPETRATTADVPEDAEFFGITFKLGTFMPRLPLKTLLDRQDTTLPEASSRTFWLDGSAWELPSFETADVFVERLIHEGLLVRDPVIETALQGHRPDMSLRTLQQRFLRATGLPHKTIQQIERAQNAATLLEGGRSIVATALELGYFDQAHLTHALKRFIGRTPAQLVQESVSE